jgi:hypothetical protein
LEEEKEAVADTSSSPAAAPLEEKKASPPAAAPLEEEKEAVADTSPPLEEEKEAAAVKKYNPRISVRNSNVLHIARANGWVKEINANAISSRPKKDYGAFIIADIAFRIGETYGELPLRPKKTSDGVATNAFVLVPAPYMRLAVRLTVRSNNRGSCENRWFVCVLIEWSSHINASAATSRAQTLRHLVVQLLDGTVRTVTPSSQVTGHEGDQCVIGEVNQQNPWAEC